MTVDILNVLSQAEKMQLGSAIQQALETDYLVFTAPIQLMEDKHSSYAWKNQLYLDP